jgi:hypothetical protein
MDRPTAATTPAAMLHDGAHAMRNDLATLRMAARLVDDEEVGAAITEAVDDLQVRLERAVVAARIELDERPAAVRIDAAELVRLGLARAAREGASGSEPRVRIDGDELAVPGPWAERLVADLQHGADPAWIAALADACGLAVTWGADEVAHLRSTSVD